ncbi:2OG-Fe dioxygenase family protein [Glaciimonas sp. GG7]
MILNLNDLRREISALFDAGPKDFDENQDLLLLGLDSIQIMCLISKLKSSGVSVRLNELLDNPTLRSWWTLVNAKRDCVASLRPEVGGEYYVGNGHSGLNLRDWALAKIAEIRSDYTEKRSVFIAGDQMIRLLRALGAADNDLVTLQQVSNNLPKDPTLPFRESRNGRFCFDPDNSRIFRSEFQPFILSAEEDFVRYDSGQVRRFEEIGNDLQLNTVFQALLIFQFLIFKDMEITHRSKLNYETSRWVCTLFNLRTITTPDLVGEPALEGVHSDGVDHTMTTFLGSENITDNSAITFLHDVREKNATKWNKTSPEFLLGQSQHRHFLDTLLIVDHEKKHSLSPVSAIDTNRSALRDMLIFFTRKPVVAGHVSHPYDSLNPHVELPMSVDLLTIVPFVNAASGDVG